MPIYEAAFMFTPEELRQAEIFACLDEAECARLAQTIADVRLEPGEWLFREGAPATVQCAVGRPFAALLAAWSRSWRFRWRWSERYRGR